MFFGHLMSPRKMYQRSQVFPAPAQFVSWQRMVVLKKCNIGACCVDANSITNFLASVPSLLSGKVTSSFAIKSYNMQFPLTPQYVFLLKKNCCKSSVKILQRHLLREHKYIQLQTFLLSSSSAVSHHRMTTSNFPLFIQAFF